MWMLITSLSMLMYAGTEITGKKSASDNSEYSVLKLRISVITVDGLAVILLCIFYYAGDFAAPFRILAANPLVIISASLNVLDTFLYLAALKYIGLTIQEAYYGAASIMVFLGMIFINLISGEFGDVNKMLVPGKLAAIVLMLAGSFILPRSGGAKEDSDDRKKLSRHNLLLGLMFTFFGLVLDAAEMILSALIFIKASISSVDYMASASLLALFWGVIFYIILYCKTNRVYIPISKENRLYVIYGLCNIVYALLYLYGIKLAPVQSNILWTAYPIIPIIGSFILLKERYSLKQYVCIGVILASSTAFCIMDCI